MGDLRPKTRRTQHLSVEKGAEAKAIAHEIKKEVFSGAFEDRDVRVAKGREAKEQAFRHASQLQDAVISKSFDCGLICGSEHNLVVVETVRQP